MSGTANIHPPAEGFGRSTWNIPEPGYDLVVVGAGHAGIEAALAGARLGLRTMIITMSLHTIGQLSCNPAMGGVGKGQLIREIDALGGEMAKLADASGLQFRMLNRSKGPAVWSPRSQCDKQEYARLATQALFDQPGLDLRQGMVRDLLFKDRRVHSVELGNGTRIRCHAVILCAGTFLNGVLHVGSERSVGGRGGEPAATGLSDALAKAGIVLRRFKTGTPPRVDRESIDFSALEEQVGDSRPSGFRHYENLIRLPARPCHISWTSEHTHSILRENLARSPLFAGAIEGVGPRYCPSVEDKVVRFADKERHQLFLEPETLNGREMYVNGFSTSMPEDVQWQALRTVPGFERVRLTRPGYAIEYDCFPAWQLLPSLRLKNWDNLFFAGQINGTSGYEEAAAQGLLAALNVAAGLRGHDPVVPGRHEAFLGVLVDDLVNKPLPEPYRMFTSRAEFRLLLRQDNADRRLMPLGNRLGLLEAWRWERFQAREVLRDRLSCWLATTKLVGSVLARRLSDSRLEEAHQQSADASASREFGEWSGVQRAAQWLKRPEVGLSILLESAPEPWFSELDEDLITGVEVEVKYEGYIERQRRMVTQFERNEQVPLPDDLDYLSISTLCTEARQRLAEVRPATLGQASRVGGVNPTDIHSLWVVLQQRHRGATPPPEEEGSTWNN
jgi:tRNA uridine 5-carboxymethylaminomethyl modification enzyme